MAETTKTYQKVYHPVYDDENRLVCLVSFAEGESMAEDEMDVLWTDVMTKVNFRIARIEEAKLKWQKENEEVLQLVLRDFQTITEYYGFGDSNKMSRWYADIMFEESLPEGVEIPDLHQTFMKALRARGVDVVELMGTPYALSYSVVGDRNFDDLSER